MKTLIVLLVSVFLLCAFQASIASARTWYILPDGGGDAPTIQAGIDSAATGDIVEVACGTYHDCRHVGIGPNGLQFLTCIIMKSGVTLRSETGDPDCVIVDAQGTGRPIFCMNVDGATIEGITFTNGRAVDGGVYRFSGAGMFCYGSSLTLLNCDFTNNVANYVSSPLSMGGGIHSRYSYMELTRCRFYGNTSGTGGGGMYSGRDNVVVLDRCIFAGNEVADGYGGGFDNEGYSAATLFNCTFYDNFAPDEKGAAICCGPGSLDMRNTLVAFNRGNAVNLISASVSFENCDFHGNEGGDWTGNLAGWLFVFGNFSADPCFCDPEAGDLQLCADSWCLPARNPWGYPELVGALGAGCGGCSCVGPVQTESISWGGVKTLYR